MIFGTNPGPVPMVLVTGKREPTLSAKRILTASARLFAAKGYDGTGVQEIADAASVTKATLFHHFKSKAGLVDALLTAPLTALVAEQQALIAEVTDPEDRLARHVQAMVAFSQEDPDRARFFFALWFGPLGGEAVALMAGHAEQLCLVVDRLAAELAESGRMAPGSVDDFALAVRGLIVEATMQHLYHDRPIDDQFGRRVVRALIAGFGTRPETDRGGKPPMTSKRGSLATLLVTIGLGLFASGCGGGKTGDEVTLKAQERIIKVTAAKVEVRDLPSTVQATGSLRGWEEVELGAKRGGRLIKLHHDMGDVVKPGEPLADLDPVDARLAVEQAQRRLDADLAKLNVNQLPEGTFDVNGVPSVVRAKLALDRANLTFNRERTLRQRGQGLPEDYDFALNDQRGAAAALDDAISVARASLASVKGGQAALAESRQYLVDLNIVAPMPTNVPHPEPVYRVRRRLQAEGQILRDGDPMFELVITDPLRLWATVPERYIGAVALGQKAKVTVQAYPGEEFEAEVARINPAVDPTNRTFQAELKVANADGRLKPGGFGRATIDVGQTKDARVVPIDAVVDFAGNSKVFILEKDNTVRELKVTKGRRGPGWIEILGADLPADATVILTGQGMLSEGSKVELRPAAAPEVDAATKTAARS